MTSASKPSMPESLSPQGIMEMATAFMRSRVLLTAYELDLFTVLGEESRSSSQVAHALGTDERATDRLMNALCAMGLLEKREGRFSNTHLASRILVKGKPDFMAGLMHMADLWETWSTLTDEDRTGPPFAALFALNMLVGTEAGDTYTESEVRQWMEQEGLGHVVRNDTPFGTTLIIGKNGGGEGTRETASRR